MLTTSMRRALLLAPLLAIPAAFALASPAAADPHATAEPAYPLDTLAREAPDDGGDLDCTRVEVQAYRGDVVRYKPEVWVNAPFRDRLRAFEGVVRDVGIEVYGRAPDRILSLGAYGCRRMREHAGLMSEHALGNAIDIAGFDFGHLPRGAKLPAGLDPVFANGFGVRVLGDWGKKAGWGAVHARFLRTLIQRLVARDDVFRVLLGPGFPGHKNHFHFDMSTFRWVQIFEDGKLIQGA
jgi:hypothetical protein